MGFVELHARRGVLARPPLGRKSAQATALGLHDRRAGREFDDLVRAIATTRDHAAFGRLFDLFAERLKRYMQRLGATEDGAEDLTQETMLMVWRKAELFDPTVAAAAVWIFAIARNLCFDAARRAQRSHRLARPGFGQESDVDMAILPDDRLVAEETTGLLRRAVAKLSIAEKRLIDLSFFEDKPHGEISRTLEMPLGTVKSRTRRAIVKLRDVLTGELLMEAPDQASIGPAQNGRFLSSCKAADQALSL